MILLYTFWYGAGRAWIEGLRTDSLYWGQFRVSQVLAFGSAIIALGLFIFFKIKFSKVEGYLLYSETDESKRKIADFEEKIRKEKEGEKAPSILAEEFQDGDSDEVDVEDSDVLENADDSQDEENIDEIDNSDEVDEEKNDSQNGEEV